MVLKALIWNEDSGFVVVVFACFCFVFQQQHNKGMCIKKRINNPRIMKLMVAEREKERLLLVFSFLFYYYGVKLN
jgi:hypothetical protein